MKNRLIVALDVASLNKAKRLVDMLYPAVKIFKIGSQLFTAAGPEAVKMVHKKRAKVFLDLKFHDIPNTVFQALRQAGAMKVFMANIHTSGAAAMMRKAVKAKNSRMLVLGVTVLTSMDRKALASIGINKNPLSQVVRLAKLAKRSGLDGVVCSGNEIKAVRKACGKKFVIVTPGIRPLATGIHDQVRIMTPRSAISQGADYIVVGRPVTQAKDPLQAARSILDDIA